MKRYPLEQQAQDLNPGQLFLPSPPRKHVLRFHSRNQNAREIDFIMSNDYELYDVVGEGAYGVVASGRHVPTGTLVAVKKIQPFSRPLFCMRTLREVKLLKHFDNENVISILDIQRPRSLDDLNDVYIVQELMDTDLSRIIRSQPLSDDHSQYFTYQILRALKVLHSADVLHRDLKPGNLLVNSNCDLKVCDFGLARSALPHGGDAQEKQTGFMTEYVATRWYRAPEIMLTFQHYTKAIDMWSVGCILAEMLGGVPLFPGKDYCDQLTLILEVVGSPSQEHYYHIKSRRARQYMMSLPFYQKKDFRVLYPQANPQALDLLDRLLTFNPDDRITVEEALSHPYVSAYHEPQDEPVAPPLPPNFFDFESNQQNMSGEDMRRLVFDEIWNPHSGK